MSKKESKIIREEDEVKETAPVKLSTTFAVLAEVGAYRVIAVDYDPSKAKVIRLCSTRDEAVEAFKIEIAKTGMLG